MERFLWRATDLIVVEAPGEYVIRRTTDGLSAVAAFRLPFDRLSDIERAFRAALAAQIRTFDPLVPLTCVYVSDSREPCDVENVLVYNVGVSAFRQTASLSVERRYAQVRELPHRYEYSCGPLAVRRTGRRIAAFEFATEPSHLRSASRVWLAARERAPAETQQHEGPFAIDVRVLAPIPLRPAVLMKPVLDGVVSALHEYSGRVVSAVAELVGARTALPPSRVAAALASRGGPLGPREVVRPYRGGVKWDPADDRCVRATIQCEPSNSTHVEVAVEAVEPSAI